MSDAMTRSDRETLLKIARQRERVAKSDAKERAARLMMEFEMQLDRKYHWAENDTWAKAMTLAKEAVEAAREQVRAECEKLGIPPEFSPDLDMHWYSRGENALKERRAELRRIAGKQIESATKAAIAAIERRSVETQEKIMIGGLSNEEARQYLESMPTAEALMPELSIDRVETLRIEERSAR